MEKFKQMSKFTEGDTLPDFKLKNQHGELVNISDFIGKKNLVLFFYPKDDTPGCTREACSFRDHYETFVDAGAEVIGISGQSVESHKNFAEKHNLKYQLLSDEKNKVRKQFGVPTNMFGLLPGRVTYVADKTGKVISVFNSQTQVEKHVEEALKALGKK
jgi:thioredoxin-dependent peroxiredoxin